MVQGEGSLELAGVYPAGCVGGGWCRVVVSEIALMHICTCGQLTNNFNPIQTLLLRQLNPRSVELIVVHKQEYHRFYSRYLS